MRPDWHTYYMNIAFTVAQRSTCLRRTYGAVIVNNHRIISTGYNGAMRGAPNCVDVGICYRQKLGIKPGERYELCVAVHAEANAIINANPSDMKGAAIYIAGYEVANGKSAMSKPCLMCCRMIRNAGLNEVIYWNNEQDEINVYPIKDIQALMPDFSEEK